MAENVYKCVSILRIYESCRSLELFEFEFACYQSICLIFNILKSKGFSKSTKRRIPVDCVSCCFERDIHLLNCDDELLRIFGCSHLTINMETMCFAAVV